MHSIKYLSAIVACLYLSACATLFGSKYQTVPIISNPSGAIVKITNEQGKVVFNGITPTKVFLNKSNGSYLAGSHYTIELSKTGYTTIVKSLQTKINFLYLLNPISAVSVDAFNGTLYFFNEDTVVANLKLLEIENQDKKIEADKEVSKIVNKLKGTKPLKQFNEQG
jgi:hypothetical protein